MREMFGDGDPFSDFFHTFFGGRPAAEDAGRRGARRRGARARGRDATSSRRSSSRSRTRITARRGGSSIKHDGQARTVDVRIPAGVGDGSRVRVGGEGERGSGGAQSGDLYLRIRLAPHPTLRAQGPRPLHARAGSADDRGARRRSRGADARRQVAAAEDSADDAERPGASG